VESWPSQFVFVTSLFKSSRFYPLIEGFLFPIKIDFDRAEERMLGFCHALEPSAENQLGFQRVKK
jgi:hypothetical protein